MESVLPVSRVPYDERAAAMGDISNMTAEQYLSWVSKQSEQMPSVVRAHVDTSRHAPQSKYMPQIDDICQCPENLRPTDEWVRDVLFTFSELRQTLATLSDTYTPQNKAQPRAVAVPAMKDTDSWMAFCLGLEVPQVSQVPVRSHAFKGGGPRKSTETRAGGMELDSGSVSSESSSERHQKELGGEGEEEFSEEGEGEGGGEEDGTMNGDSQQIARADGLRTKKKRLLEWLDSAPSAEAGAVLTGSDRIVADAGFNEPPRPCPCPCPPPSTAAAAVAVAVAEASPSLQAPSSTPTRWAGVWGHQPTTALLLQFDQVLTQRLLSMHTDWLCDPPNERRSRQRGGGGGGIRSRSGNISEPQGQWLYALLARLERPLYQDTAAVVRQLFRRCCELRLHLATSRDDDDDDDACVGNDDQGEEGEEGEEEIRPGEEQSQSDDYNPEACIASLNVLISITGSYFGQSEEPLSPEALAVASALRSDDSASDSEGRASDSDTYSDPEDFTTRTSSGGGIKRKS